jgi:hypothetical protein
MDLALGGFGFEVWGDGTDAEAHEVFSGKAKGVA